MGLLGNLMEDPPNEKVEKMKKYSLIAVIVIYAIMGVIYYFSYSPFTNMLTGQLSFSADYLRYNIYTAVSWENPFNLTLYMVAQGIDYLFMISYGTLLYSLGITIGRNSEKGSLGQKLSFTAAQMGVIAAFCDAFENLFIFATLTNITGFPDWLAIAHSSFAAIKWGLLALSIIFILVSAFMKKK